MAELPLTRAGLRELTIELPAGLPVLSLNDRLHWRKRHERGNAIREAAWALAMQQRAPRLERAAITVTYQPPDRRRRDADNMAASGKPAIDGLILAGVLPDDNAAHVTAVRYRIGPVHPRGRLIIHVREVQEQEP